MVFYERDYVQLVPIEEKKCQSYIVDQKSMQFLSFKAIWKTRFHSLCLSKS